MGAPRQPSPPLHNPASPKKQTHKPASPKLPSPPKPIALPPILHIKVHNASFNPKLKHYSILRPYVLFLTSSGDTYQTSSIPVVDGAATWEETLSLPEPIGGDTLDLACYDETTEEHIGEATDVAISVMLGE